VSDTPSLSNSAAVRRDFDNLKLTLENIIVSIDEPRVPRKGQGWFDPTTLIFKIFDGKDWVLSYIEEFVAGSIHIPDKTSANSWHVDNTGVQWAGCNVADRNADIENANFYVLPTGYVKGKHAEFTTNVILNGLQAGTEIAIQGWQQDMAFSATDEDTVAWTSGTITLLDGTTYIINSGNTGDISARTYIYLDTAISITVLQISTTPSDAVGSGKILIAVAENVVAGKDAEYQVFGGSGGFNKLFTADSIAANTITANEIVANTITATEIAVGTITATEIAAGTITATEIAANTITATEMNVSQLSAITANLGTITAGSIGAGSATIGAFSIGAASISATNLTLVSGAANAAHIAVGSGANLAGLNSGNASTDIAIWAGANFANRATAPFRATLGGKIYADDVETMNIQTNLKLGGSDTIGVFELGETIAAGEAISFGKYVAHGSTIDADTDTYVDETNPTTNYSSTDPLLIGNQSSNKKYSYFSWDLEAELGLNAGELIEVISADFVFRNETARSGNIATAYIIKDSWDASTITWNSQAAYTFTSMGSSSIASAGWVTISMIMDSDDSKYFIENGLRLSTGFGGGTGVASLEDAGGLFPYLDNIVYMKNDGKIYKSTSSYAQSGRMMSGFLATGGDAADTSPILTSGAVLTTTGLTPGETYWLSNTSGEISTTPGTYSRIVGKALSATKLLIDLKGLCFLGTRAVVKDEIYNYPTGTEKAICEMQSPIVAIGINGIGQVTIRRNGNIQAKFQEVGNINNEKYTNVAFSGSTIRVTTDSTDGQAICSFYG